MGKESEHQTIPALKVLQWLDEWNKFDYDKNSGQAKPDNHFYMFSLPASDLKRLTGVYRRSAREGTPRAKDPNVQRGHEVKRSEIIREFVRGGFPWCEMSEAKRKVKDAGTLRKPGWLPTAILVNILERNAIRNGKKIPDADLITVNETDTRVDIVLPKTYSSKSWEPQEVYPLEVIDGQHRLWAFEKFDPGEDFELPVVAFHGLDRSWQAYLFWSVNITPKRINRSLAYDLYPLLRREDWLDKFAGHAIYRETRSQELVEALWSHPQSPWYQRINMLGETTSQRGSKVSMVSQAAWVRSLMATFVKEWVKGNSRAGGLFGAPRSADDPFLPWNRAMQAAFLIRVGAVVRDEVIHSKSGWAHHLREVGDEEADGDAAFYGRFSLLTTDQGVRGLLFAANDLCYAQFKELKLNQWRWEDVEYKVKRKVPATDEGAVTAALDSLDDQPVTKFLIQIARELSLYDWRTSSTPDLPEKSRIQQSVFRGSSGYKEMRIQLLKHLLSSQGAVAVAAAKVKAAE